MIGLLLIALGGAAGAASRFTLDRAIAQRVASSLPWGTWVVNLSGSFLLGLVVASSLPPAVAAPVGVGFLGAYTTFSTWMYESLHLIEHGAWRLAAINLLGPALTGPLAAVAGLLVGSVV